MKQYRIQKRKYSSNVIEKLIIENGKEKWKVHLCPTERKSVGDVVCEELLEFLNYEKPLKWWEKIKIQKFLYKFF